MAVEEKSTADGVQAWARTALVAGVISAVGLFVQTLLFLIDAAEILPGSPPFRETSAGRDRDLATFFIGYFERQHGIAWDIAIRDTIGPVAAIALLVLARALVHVRGQGRAGPQVWALVFGVGALLKLLSDLAYLSQLGLWRYTGFTAEPPADIIAGARASDAVTYLADYLEHAAFVALAVGLAGLATLLSRRLRLLALSVAGGLLVATVASLAYWFTVYEVAAVLTGAVLGPALLVGIGRSLVAVDRRA